MQIAKWTSLVFRGFGIANFILACAGLRLLGSSVFAIREKVVGNTSEHPYFLPVFWTMTTVNLVLLTLLIFSGIRLLQLRTLGVVVSNAVFVAEITYFIVFSLLSPVSTSIAAGFAVGSMGLSPQLICGYPLFALVFLNLARRRLQTPIGVAHDMPG
jgi:hypothetical protein